MKYLSLILVGVIFTLSWFIANKEQPLTSGEKQRLLKVIQDYMTQKVLDKEPNAKDIQFADLYTEEIEKGQTLKAHFKFSYLQTDENQNTQKVHRKGHFFVASADGKQWRAQISEIGDVQVEFMDALEIQGDPSVTQDSMEPTESPESETSNSESSLESDQ